MEPVMQRVISGDEMEMLLMANAHFLMSEAMQCYEPELLGERKPRGESAPSADQQ